MQMRPMSEAPKDGAEILAVWIDGSVTRGVEFCRWDVNRWFNRDEYEVTGLIAWYGPPDYENDKPIIE